MSLHPAHVLLDASLAVAVVTVVTLLVPGGVASLLCSGVDFLRAFPDHYQPVFDFVSSPMDPVLAIVVWLVDVYFLVKTYCIEGLAVRQAHKKYAAHRTKAAVAVHGIGSTLELLVGLLAVLSLAHPEAEATRRPVARPAGMDEASSALLRQLLTFLAQHQLLLCRSTAVLALLVNVPSGLVLTPGVFGVKHLTAPGFFKFAMLRSMEAVRVLIVDHRLLPNLWILLHVGTVVRLLGYFVLPYTSTTHVLSSSAAKTSESSAKAALAGRSWTSAAGRRGDLFTEPMVYSFNILLSGYLTAAFVYPPKYLLGSLMLYAAAQLFWPPRVSLRHGLRVDDAPVTPQEVRETRGPHEKKLE